MKKVITIDGPASSGKSTVGKKIARKLGFSYLNSGLLYRALAYAVLRDMPTNAGMCDVHEVKLEEYLTPGRLAYSWNSDGSEKVIWDQSDITKILKTGRIDQCSSILSQNSRVRNFILMVQRSLLQQANLVADGRDMGSVVFPAALVKFFLTADPEVRARRWQKDEKERGNEVALVDAITHIVERDKRDQERSIAPLIEPKGAIFIDSTQKDSEAIVREMMVAIQEKMAT